MKRLKDIERPRNSRAIEIARGHGDLKENADYSAAKEEQGKTEARIGHLSALIERAVIIDHEGDIDSVVQGTVVTILYEDDDDEEQYLIGSIEERRDGIEVISPTSPLGEALLGAKAGDEVTFEAPSGPLKVEVIRIER